jgi:hypothetical protein
MATVWLEALEPVRTLPKASVPLDALAWAQFQPVPLREMEMRHTTGRSGRARCEAHREIRHEALAEGDGGRRHAGDRGRTGDGRHRGERL